MSGMEGVSVNYPAPVGRGLPAHAAANPVVIAVRCALQAIWLLPLDRCRGFGRRL